jgi:PAS domain S-box-containing protein
LSRTTDLGEEVLESGRSSLAWRVTLTIIGVAVALTLALIPVADRPGPVIPGIIPFFVAGVLASALATSFLLFTRFREARAWSLLLLAGAYLHLGVVSIAHLMTFPGAMLPDRALIGTPQSPAWIFVLWVAGYAVLSFVSILAEIRFKDRGAAQVAVVPAIGAVIAAVLAADVAMAAVATIMADRLPVLLQGTSWTAPNYIFSIGTIGSAGCGVALILTAVDRRNTLFLWLALTLAAFASANILAAAGGGRFTVGWIAGRLTWVISSGILFPYFMARFARQQRALADARDALKRRVEDRTAALRAIDARLRHAIEAAPFPLMLHASDGEVLALSDAWTALTGYSRDELRTRFDWTRRAYPDNFAEVDAFIDQQFRIAKATATGERTIRAKDGPLIWHFTNIPLGMLPDGRPLTLTAVMDVTKRKQDEARQRLLTREVDHRAKNMLAVLQVMLRHTRADTVKDYAEAVQGRVAALARTHTLLAQSRWEA